MSNAAYFASPEHAAANPELGPVFIQIEIDGRPYRGAMTRRALKTAITKARVSYCLVLHGRAVGYDGTPIRAMAYRPVDLAHICSTYIG